VLSQTVLEPVLVGDQRGPEVYDSRSIVAGLDAL
jgi:hypothetical protein